MSFGDPAVRVPPRVMSDNSTYASQRTTNRMGRHGQAAASNYSEHIKKRPRDDKPAPCEAPKNA